MKLLIRLGLIAILIGALFTNGRMLRKESAKTETQIIEKK